MSEDLYPVVKVEYENGPTIWIPYEQHLAMKKWEDDFWHRIAKTMYKEAATAYYDQTWKHNLAQTGTFYRL